jgi:hypothetical protein
MWLHVKHLLIVTAILLIAYISFRSYVSMEIQRSRIDQDTAVKVKEAEVKVAAAQQKGQVAEQANVVVDKTTAKQLAALKSQLAKHPDLATVKKMVEAALPGVKVNTSNNKISVDDSQATRDAINKVTVEYKVCTTDRDGCQAKQANLQTIITSREEELAVNRGTIKTQGNDITDLRRNQVPRWTVMFGVGKTQGNNISDVAAYQPVLGLDYRLTQRFGIFTVAQNKAVAAGISFRFGGVR